MQINKLRKDDRVFLTPLGYLSRVKLGCFVLIVACAASISLLVLNLGITFQVLGISLMSILITALFCNFLYKNSRAASIKADNLIVKTFKNKSILAPLGSIRSMKTRSFLGLRCTRISFRIDGHTTSFIILSNAMKTQSPESLLRNEIHHSKQKKMVNHKPGSVLMPTA